MPTADDALLRRRAWRLLLLCAMLWSLNGPLIKHLQTVHHQSGMSIAVWRSVFAALLLSFGAWRHRATIQRTVWWIPAVISFAAMCGLFVSATTLTEASNAIILQYTAPFWVLLLGPILLKEPTRRTDWFVLPVAMSGVAVIFFFQHSASGAGLLLALGAGVAFAFVILSFRQLRRVNALALPCVVNIATVLILAPIAVYWNLAPLPTRVDTWFWLALMGGVQMALPYWLLTLGIQHARAADAALITLAEPLMNTLLTWIIIKETPPLSTLGGGGAILAALVLKNLLDRITSSRAARRHPT